MIGDRNANATIAVKDLDVAKKFYESTLGLKPENTQESEVTMYKSGNSMVQVYKSRYAGTNKATAATWIVGDELEGIVKNLKAKGVSFEHYDFPDTTLQGDVHVMGKTKAAWFKDPDGNILSLVSH
jgi:catechol-2,3-dioxygenase